LLLVEELAKADVGAFSPGSDRYAGLIPSLRVRRKASVFAVRLITSQVGFEKFGSSSLGRDERSSEGMQPLTGVADGMGNVSSIPEAMYAVHDRGDGPHVSTDLGPDMNLSATEVAVRHKSACISGTAAADFDKENTPSAEERDVPNEPTFISLDVAQVSVWLSPDIESQGTSEGQCVDSMLTPRPSSEAQRPN